jgi:hypothetical protein
MTIFIFIMSLLFSFASTAQSQLGEVIGNVVNEDGYPAIYAHVFIDDQFGQRYQARTDEDGRFRISAVPVGEYTLNIRQFGDTLKGIPVEVQRDGFHNCGEIVFSPQLPDICTCPPYEYVEPLDLFAHTYVELEREIIDHHVNRLDFDALIESSSSEMQITENEIIARGAKNPHVQFIDGDKLRGDLSLPSAAYHNIKIYTNGIPAKYGDTQGLVIDIETRGYFEIHRDWKEEQLKQGR